MMSFLTLLLIDVTLMGCGAILWYMPRLMQHQTLFGVTVAPDFRASMDAKHMAQRFRQRILAGTALAVVLGSVAALADIAWLLPVSVILLTAIGVQAYIAEWHAARAFQAVAPMAKTASLRSPQNVPPAPWSTVFALVPLAAAAALLRWRWQSIPALFPAHWDAQGRVNRWVHKTPFQVYFPVILGVVIVLFQWLLLALVRWGARTPASSERQKNWHFMTEIVGAASWLIAIVFSGIALTPLLAQPLPWVIGLVLLSVVTLILALLWISVRAARARTEDPDRTPDEAWIFGILYFNRTDPALFVANRTGIGYTLNFAHRVSWLLVAGPLVVTFLLIVIVHATS